MSEERRCPGCGAIFQSIDDTQEGYIPASLLARKDAICQRCFQLQHYGKFKTIPIHNEELLKIYQAATKEKALFVFIVDIFNFYGSMIEDLEKHIGKSKLYVIVNKYDLLPKSVKEERIKKWVETRLCERNLNPVEITLVSAINNKNMDGLLDKISKHADNHNIYFIGNANVGKSSIINSLMKQYKNTSTQYITSSIYPGTTLNVVKIPYENDTFLYDTPGLMNDFSIYQYLDGRNLKRVVTSKEIKPINMTLYSKQSLFIGTVAIVDIIKGGQTPIILYGSEFIKYHRTKLATSGEKFSALLKEPLYLPKPNCLLKKEEMDVFDFDINTDHRISLIINGLVWLDILKGKVTLKIYVPKGVNVILSEPIIGGKKYANNK